MKKNTSLLAFTVLIAAGFMAACNEKATVQSASTKEASYGGYESPELWGEHLVTVSACNDCHSPKKMTPQGPDIDSSRLLSGHPASDPDPAVNRKDLESKGLTTTGDLTTWVGPWGVSYTANLTSDPTGIGTWDEGRFIYAIRQGKFKGSPGARNLLPPMPWQMYRNMRDDELKAIFAYLKSTKPIRNVVPEPKPPIAATQH